MPIENTECLSPWVEGNQCDAPVGPKLFASNGWWVMLEPLEPGSHQLRIEGIVGTVEDPMFSLNITYHLTITDE